MQLTKPSPYVAPVGKDLFRKLLAAVAGSRLARNASWMFVGQTAQAAVQAGYFIVLARLLGSKEYGILAGATALISLVSPYAAFGSGLLIVRYVSPNRKVLPEYWGNVFLSIASIGGPLVLILCFTGHKIDFSASVGLILVLAVADCWCGQLALCAAQVFQATERMKITATLNTLTNVFRLCLALILLVSLHRANAQQWAAASLVVSLAAAALAVAKVTAEFGWPIFAPRLFLSRAFEGLVFAVSGSTTSAYNDIDKAMLGHYGMTAANGIYTTAYRIVDVAAMPIRSLHSAAFPRFFQLGIEGSAQTIPFARKLLQRTVVLASVASLAMFFAAPVLPRLLGPSYALSVPALRWLCLIPIFRCFHLSAGDALAGAGFQNVRLASQLTVALGNFGLNIYLIPKYSWVGAAWASLLTDFSLGVIAWGALLWIGNLSRRNINRTLEA